MTPQVQAAPANVLPSGGSLPVFNAPAARPPSLPRRLALVAASGLAWLLVYASLPTVADWITHGLLDLPPAGHPDEVCPVFLGKARRLHWPLPDPTAAAGTDEERLEKFREVRDEIRRRLPSLFETFTGVLAHETAERDRR